MDLYPLRHHVSARQFAVAAEAIAASQFALNGFDVLEQAGQAQFAYDLGVANAAGMLKVSVYASVGEYWDPLSAYQSAIPRENFDHAADMWAKRHGGQAICLVHFDGLDLGRMPQIYLVSAPELAQTMHQLRNARSAAWQLERELGVESLVSVRDLPAEWRFSPCRIHTLMHGMNDEPSTVRRGSRSGKAGTLVAA